MLRYVRIEWTEEKWQPVKSRLRFANCISSWQWRWLPHRLSKRQLQSRTVLFRTTFTRTIMLNLLMKWLLGSFENVWKFVTVTWSHVYQASFWVVVLRTSWFGKEKNWSSSQKKLRCSVLLLPWGLRIVDIKPSEIFGTIWCVLVFSTVQTFHKIIMKMLSHDQRSSAERKNSPLYKIFFQIIWVRLRRQFPCLHGQPL